MNQQHEEYEELTRKTLSMIDGIMTLSWRPHEESSTASEHATFDCDIVLNLLHRFIMRCVANGKNLDGSHMTHMEVWKYLVPNIVKHLVEADDELAKATAK